MDGKVNVWREYNKKNIQNVIKYLEDNIDVLLAPDVAEINISITQASLPEISVKKVLRNG